MTVAFRRRGRGGGPRTGRPLGCVWAAGVDARVCIPCSFRTQSLHNWMPRAGLEEGLGAPGPAADPEMGGWEDGLQAGIPSGPPPSHTAPCSPPPLPSRQRSRKLEATGSQDLLPTRSSRLGLPLQSPRLSWSVGLVFGDSFRTCLCGASGMSVPVTFLSWRNLRPTGCLAPVLPLFSSGCPSAALFLGLCVLDSGLKSQ